MMVTTANCGYQWLLSWRGVWRNSYIFIQENAKKMHLKRWSAKWWRFCRPRCVNTPKTMQWVDRWMDESDGRPTSSLWHYGNQSRGYFNYGRPSAMATCCAPACSQALPVKPQGVWARGSEAWAGSRDLRNLEFVRWGSSGPSSLMVVADALAPHRHNLISSDHADSVVTIVLHISRVTLSTLNKQCSVGR